MACPRATRAKLPALITLTVTGDRWILNQVPEPGCTVAVTSISGSWKFTGDQVAFHEDRNIGCDQDSTYKWSFDGTALTLTQVQDICARRVVVNTLRPWVKTTAPPPAPTAAIATPAPNATVAPNASMPGQFQLVRTMKGDGKSFGPNVIALDKNGNAFVRDDDNSRVIKFSPTGAVLTELASVFFQWINYSDRDGNVYVADRGQ